MAPQREWFEKDYYEILGVEPTADAKEITKAYRKLARELHPDRNPGNTVAEERFKEVSAAYDVLHDEDKRREYDEVRRLGPMAGGGGGGGFRFNVNDVRDQMGGFGDIFGQMFGRGGAAPGGARRRSGAGPRRGADVRAALDVDFEDAVYGMTTTLHLVTDVQCTTCRGSGARPGTSPSVCSNCHGRGVVDDNQGMFSFSSPCPVCSGAGSVIEDPCPTCHGAGTMEAERAIKTRIPAGVRDGQTIRLKGKGAPGFNGGPNGDLLVDIHVEPHAHFGRNGNDLTVAVTVPFWQAALGETIGVPTLRGPDVVLRLKPGTQGGSRHRVRGKGVPASTGTGDLIVTVNVEVPRHLTKEQRAAIEAFKQASLANSDGAPEREFAS